MDRLLKKIPLFNRMVDKLPINILENPWEAWIAFTGFFAGIATLITGVDPKSIDASLPTVIAYSWHASLTFGCLGIFIGLVTNRLEWEMAGLELFGPATLIYALTVYLYTGLAGAFAGTFFIALFLASLLQISSIRKGYRYIPERD